MAARKHVPEFGNWESQENVPYTEFFDKARKGRGGKMINPNDPQENPEMFSNVAPSPPAANVPSPSRVRAKADETNGRGSSVKSQHDRGVSREDGNLRQFADSPARGDNLGRRTSGESTHQHHSSHGSHGGRPVRHGAGSEHSIERSPLHSSQAKLTGRGGTSPGWDGKSSYDGSYGAPGKSRMKPATRIDESPDRSAAVPRFGDWDESNPQSAENYTHVFNQVREERHNVAPSNVAARRRDPASSQQNDGGRRKGGCFACFGR